MQKIFSVVGNSLSPFFLQISVPFAEEILRLRVEVLAYPNSDFFIALEVFIDQEVRHRSK